ncbi:MAG: hypothetical protein ABI700_26445 [Chloroflexota bacterium]
MALPQPKPTAAFRKHVLALIGENYGDKTLVLCPTAFVKLLSSDHKAAILLAQILYWADRTKDPDGWFYKSYADWKAETGLSETQVRRIVNGDPRVQAPQLTLRDLGVETKLQKVKRTGAPTLHYRINQAQFLAALHAFLGQGDSQHCAGSIPDIGGNEPSAMPGIHSDQSEAALITPEITNPEISTEDHIHQNPTNLPDEDSDLKIFFPFESRFGLLKNRAKIGLRQELERLGTSRVEEVLDRCATRGRSWSYVLSALANEPPSATRTEFVTDWGAATDTGSGAAGTPFPQPQEAAPMLLISERVATPCDSAGRPAMTVLEAWNAAYYQLELQLGGNFYPFGPGVRLVDFEPETQTFILVVRTAQSRDYFEGRLARLVRRILGDVCGHPAATRFLTADEWRLRQSLTEAVAIA